MPLVSQVCVLQACLAAGAHLKGITHMDELAFSLNGENVHYGTPTNPTCPDRIPGGSSSGSVSAVAAGDVDFAFGSDTGGESVGPLVIDGCCSFFLVPAHPVAHRVLESCRA